MDLSILTKFFYANVKMKDLIAVSKIEKTLLEYLNPFFLDTKYEIIRIKVYETKNKIVQIMIDHSNKIIDIEDCAKYSRIISEFLDKKNVISQDFSL
jgi:ribosome maturation factor RimP